KRGLPTKKRLPILTRSGKQRLVAWTFAILYDQEQSIDGLITVGEDITERTHLVQQLKHSQEDLFRAETIAGVGHYNYNFARNSWTSSQGLDQILGIDADYTRDFTGWLNLVIPQDRKAMQQYFQDEVLQQKQPFDRAYRILNRRSDKVRWVHGRGQLVLDDAGQPVRLFGTILDITTVKNTELALRLSEERFRAALEGAQEGLWDWHLETDYVWHSERFATMLGYDHSEVPFHISFWQEHLHPDDREAAFARVQEYLADPLSRIYSSEFRLRHMDGSYRWIVSQGKALLDSAGQPVRFIGFNSDRTAEHELTEQLLQKERQYHEMFDQHSAIKMLINPKDGRILEANHSAAVYYGYSKEELCQKSIMDLNVLNRAEILARMENARERKTNIFEFQHRLKDGQVRDVEVHSSPIHLNDSMVLYSHIRDITEYKEQSRRLTMLSTVVEESPAYIVITDPDGIIEYCNRAFETVTGYSAAEAIGQTPRILKSNKMPIEFYEKMWATLLAGEVYRGEIINKKKNGELYWEEAIISPVRNEQDKIIHFFAIKQDVTDRKKTMQDLQTAHDRAEAANKSKVNFLGSISHEIRTPMNAIIGMTDLALELTSDEQVREYLDTVRLSAKHLLDLINDVLDTARIDSNRQELRLNSMNLIAEVKQVMHMMQVKADQKGLDLQSRLAGLPDVEVNGDARRLKQILINLIGNAIKFTESGFVRLAIRAD
ncbi:MAG: PAS domain S-box protein, partial [Leptospiraceae bacterium]|nr:PAS domain S-box protein [Leptospiraceae bacterium]